MITDKKIKEMTNKFWTIVLDNDGYKIAILEDDIKLFAHKLLSEVTLQEQLRVEEEFIWKHKERFLKNVGADDDADLESISFGKDDVYWLADDHESCESITWKVFYEWKESILGESND